MFFLHAVAHAAVGTWTKREGQALPLQGWLGADWQRLDSTRRKASNRRAVILRRMTLRMRLARDTDRGTQFPSMQWREGT